MLSALLIFWSIGYISGQDVVTLKFVFLIEEGQEHFVEWLNRSTSSIPVENFSLEPSVLVVNHDESDNSLICENFNNGATLVIDATWTGNEDAKQTTTNYNIPYIRIDLSIGPLLNLLDKYLSLRNNTDVAVIFENSQLIDQALYYWIDSTRLRMIVSDKLDKISAERLKKLRPIPNSYAIVATTNNMKHMMELAISERLVAIPERWNLVFLDFIYKNFPKNSTTEALNFLRIDSNFCCQLLDQPDECECPKDFDFQYKFLEVFFHEFLRVFHGLDNNEELIKRVSCQNSAKNDSNRFEANHQFLTALRNSSKWFSEIKDSYRLNINGVVEVVIESELRVAARLDENGKLNVVKGINVLPVKPFYRIGITYAMPWTFREKNPNTGEYHWTGYCIDFIKKLSIELNFDYELVVPIRGTFGEKDQNGEWDGIVGDIARGETDIAIAAIVMRADREEVIDYVAPYYEQAGISIVMRKPIRKTSLFRFMTVLKLEVWLSIVAALIITSFMMWFLDKYSPYSAQNNKEAYPYECRLFSLRECFWFALTSFTPQGGGEAPKSLSSRALVTAYWLFVVLMLATFTANLAAFLTVERMQTPVQSLEQLARQSRINYTVVEASDTHQYFINMKYAEDTLYRMWKELTLNASTDDVRYRVWDYPIREQYGHILNAINESLPVNDSTEGFQIVNERIDGDFAFIHDSSEIKYEISKNCNFTEIGEVFAEKPYAVVVQQGSHLSDIIGIKILDLQKDRYFEGLRAKYWNYTVRGECANEEEEEGITLESLGGVFIATLFGLVMAMITLGFEVLYYKRKSKSKKDGKKEKQAVSKPKSIKVFPNTITIGTKFEPMIRPNLTPGLNSRKFTFTK